VLRIESSKEIFVNVEFRELAIFLLIAIGALALGLLLNAGHFLWPMVLITAGAYIVPTLYVKLRNLHARRVSGHTKDLTGLDK
jgi:hypothetical protein